MRTISYIRTSPGSACSMGGVTYWRETIGERLMGLLEGDLVLDLHEGGRNRREIVRYPVRKEKADIAYCELFDIPDERPGDFVFGIISDFLGMEEELEYWLGEVHPNVLFALQYWRDDLVELCGRYGCRVVRFPWFVETREPYNPDKTLLVFMSGMIGPAYPARTSMAKVLSSLKNNTPDNSEIVVEMTDSHHAYQLTLDQYRENLRRSRFVASTGVYDIQIPPKHYEICNYGACLISPFIAHMDEVGFVDGETFLAVKNPLHILEHLRAGEFETIAKAGQRMVQERHTIGVRAATIMEEYRRG